MRLVLRRKGSRQQHSDRPKGSMSRLFLTRYFGTSVDIAFSLLMPNTCSARCS
jgi:hypothetical protein